jgi:hypothetical protein
LRYLNFGWGTITPWRRHSVPFLNDGPTNICSLMENPAQNQLGSVNERSIMLLARYEAIVSILAFTLNQGFSGRDVEWLSSLILNILTLHGNGDEILDFLSEVWNSRSLYLYNTQYE